MPFHRLLLPPRVLRGQPNAIQSAFHDGGYVALAIGASALQRIDS
tara:strand:- start:3983 stop:4117 length:135 start_codon:yes stop_codon:yes gene_type:complete